MQGELEAKVEKLEKSWNELGKLFYFAISVITFFNTLKWLSDIPETSASTTSVSNTEQVNQTCNDDMYLDSDEEQTGNNLILLYPLLLLYFILELLFC